MCIAIPKRCRKSIFRMVVSWCSSTISRFPRCFQHFLGIATGIYRLCLWMGLRWWMSENLLWVCTPTSHWAASLCRAALLIDLWTYQEKRDRLKVGTPERPWPNFPKAGHLCAVVRLVWLQPRQHLGHARLQHRCLGGSGRDEHHPVGRHWWHHRLRVTVLHHQKIRRGWPVQWHFGRLGGPLGIKW